MLIRKFLFANGLRYRLHSRNLPGKPDLVFPRFKKILFIHGCYWHVHDNCKYFVTPKTRTEWWMNKIDSNKNKDIENISKLSELGWNVITVWECELKLDNRERILKKLLAEITDKNE